MNLKYDTEAIFLEVLDSLDRRDIDAVVSHFTEDGVVVDYSDSGAVHRGRSEIAALIRSFFDLLPDLKMSLLDMISSPDRLAAELVLRGTPNGTAQAIAVPYCVYYAFDDGKIASEHLYLDGSKLAPAAEVTP